MFVHELIQQGQPNDIAVYQTDKELTYQELNTAVKNCRSRLYAAGVRTGDRVAIYSRNCAEYICTYMAIASLGGIVVPVNFQLSMRETAFILKNAGIHHLVTYKKLDLDAAINLHDYDGGVLQLDIQACCQPSAAPAAPKLPKDFSLDEPCVIIYTSGTTGAPKGAVLSHRNLTSNAAMLSDVLHIQGADNVLCVLPMYHCFAWTCSVLNPLLCGASITILDTFTPKETIEVIHQKKVSVAYVVPSICALLTKLAKPEDIASLRYVIIGGTTLPLAIANNFKAKFGVDIIEGYGLSEASPVCAVNPPSRVKVGSIGPVLPGISARIAAPDGTDVPEGASGELLIQGPNVMHGYWKQPEATEEALRDGWLHTGDVARRDADGYFYIVDRLKDMIISMGENIYPREIEELVYAFPGIREAAVIGIDDRLRGQAGCCYYSVQDGETVNVRALKKYLQQNLALYKIPREFRQLAELPKTTTSKIAKKELVKMYAAEKE